MMQRREMAEVTADGIQYKIEGLALNTNIDCPEGQADKQICWGAFGNCLYIVSILRAKEGAQAIAKRMEDETLTERGKVKL